jgi:NAD(P)-dependent dehydrogenase (short-subunit alcohol dehydrogenase family)
VERRAFADLSVDEWRAALRTNLDGMFLCCRAAFRVMQRGGGVIVNLASLSGVANVEKFPGLAAYNVAKAGVIALTEAVALEGREHAIVCVCLSPGAVDTEMLRRAAPHLRAGVTPDDVAAIVAFLLTSDAAPLSGTNIPIFSNA